MPVLEPRPTLEALQAYVVELERERGFDVQTALQKCLLLGEEVGELFKAARKLEGMSLDETADVGHVGEEVADVLIILLSIANRYGVDVEAAFRAKEAVNHTRRWSVR